jgi:hypothetical protein
MTVGFGATKFMEVVKVGLLSGQQDIVQLDIPLAPWCSHSIGASVGLASAGCA